MNIVVTTSGKIFKHDNHYYANSIYGNQYYRKYLSVFDDVYVVGKTIEVNEKDIRNLSVVDSENVHVIDTEKGKYASIRSCVKMCDCASLRLPDFISFYIVSLCKRYKKPFTVEVTTDVWSYLSPQNSSQKHRRILRPLWHVQQLLACRMADGVTYVTKEALQNRYPSAKMLGKKGDYFDAAFTDVDVSIKCFAQYAKQVDGQKHTYELIHVANDIGNDGKGYRELVWSVGTLVEEGHDVILHIVGDGNFSTETEDIIRQLNLYSRINKHGRIQSRKELFKLLQSSDIFVFPSYTEGLPRVVIEAMLNGLPCIVSDIPGNAELIEKDALVKVRNRTELASKIEYFVTHPEVMNYHAEKNLMKAKEYSTEYVQDLSDKFYRCLLTMAEDKC